MFWLCWIPVQPSAHAVKVDNHFRRFVQPVRFCRDIHRRGQPFATIASSPGSGGPAAGAPVGLRESSKVFSHLDLIPRRELRWSDTVPENCSGIQAIWASKSVQQWVVRFVAKCFQASITGRIAGLRASLQKMLRQTAEFWPASGQLRQQSRYPRANPSGQDRWTF